MQRLYKFILLLFLALLVLAIGFSFIINWMQFKIMAASSNPTTRLFMLSPEAVLEMSLYQGLIYALALLLIVVLLLKKAMDAQQKFTLRQIFQTAGWFFGSVLIINAILLLNYTGTFGYLRYVAQMRGAFVFPFAEWTLNILTWILLYFILASRINKFA